MFKLATTVAFCAVLAGSSVAAPTESKATLAGVPVGSPDGVYLAYLNKDGTTRWEYQGSLNATTERIASLLANSNEESEVNTLAKRSGAHCNGFGISGSNANVAQGIFADMCGGGYFWNSAAISTVYGSAVAFGCNYGSSQTCTHDGVWGDYAAINSLCGFSQSIAGAGWYRHDGSNAHAYGRTSTGSGFC